MKNRVAASLFASLAIATATPQAQELTPQQAGQYMAAAGEVLSAQRTMAGIGRVCGENATKLSPAWNDRNRSAVAKAEQLRSSVLRDIEKAKGTQTAKGFEERQDKLLSEKVANAVREIEVLPPEKKKHVCGRFVETVNQGQWDISKNTSLYAFLMNAK